MIHHSSMMGYRMRTCSCLRWSQVLILGRALSSWPLSLAVFPHPSPLQHQVVCLTQEALDHHLYTIWSCSPTPGHISGENHNPKGQMHPSAHCSTIDNSQDMETTSKSINRRIKKTYCIYTMEYYSAKKRMKKRLFAATWTNLEITIPSEVKEKDK